MGALKLLDEIRLKLPSRKLQLQYREVLHSLLNNQNW